MPHSPVAIVTGASSGIGRALARRLVDSGYRVALVSRSELKLRAVADELGEERTFVWPCDLKIAEDASAMVNGIVSEMGRLDVLANVAGMALLKPLSETGLDEWQKVMRINLTSVFITTRAAWPTFEAQGGGMIVNVSSMASRDPFEGFGAYGAAKAGVNLLTLMTAREGASFGLRAVCIAPGAVETPMLRSMFSESVIAPSKTVKPERVAELISACIDGEQPFEPGQTLRVSQEGGCAGLLRFD